MAVSFRFRYLLSVIRIVFFSGEEGGGGWIRILSNPPNNFGRTLLFVVSLHIITFMIGTNINDLTIFFKTTNMAEFLVKHNFFIGKNNKKCNNRFKNYPGSQHFFVETIDK